MGLGLQFVFGIFVIRIDPRFNVFQWLETRSRYGKLNVRALLFENSSSRPQRKEIWDKHEEVVLCFVNDGSRRSGGRGKSIPEYN